MSSDADARRLAGPKLRLKRRAYNPRELEHRIANSLQLAVDFLLFEHVRIQDPAARDVLAQAAARLSAVGHLHRFLSDHDGGADVAFRPYLTQVCEKIAEATGLRCSVEADEVLLPPGVAQQLALAANELALNAAKHAYRKGSPGDLHVRSKRREGVLEFTVADRGAGLRHDFDAREASGLGLSIVQAIVRQLKGTLAAGNDGGARFTITIPLPEPRPTSDSRSFAPVHSDRAEAEPCFIDWSEALPI
jgi:two-component system, sensor histidine kinase PdtaS